MFLIVIAVVIVIVVAIAIMIVLENGPSTEQHRGAIRGRFKDVAPAASRHTRMLGELVSRLLMVGFAS